MDDAAVISASAKTSAPRPKGLLALLTAALVLALAAAATMAAIVFLVPEENDYARATRIKHDRLETARPHKIVLVGGSNLAYGIDSTIIARETRCDVVNMGINGYFGVRYMLEEVRPQLRRGDVVVIAFEYDNYFKSTQGTGSDLLMVVKANPISFFNYLNWRQRLAVLEAIPYVAQQKVLRFIRYGFSAISDVLGTGDGVDTRTQIAEIEAAENFTRDGDLTAHLGVVWPDEREWGIDLTHNGIDPEVVPMMARFAEDMEARGVSVVVSYTPALRAFYAQHANVIDQLHQRMTQTALTVPQPPEAYVYDESMFFDTVYHLNAAGRGPRTEQVVRDLEGAIGERAHCAAAPGEQGR